MHISQYSSAGIVEAPSYLNAEMEETIWSLLDLYVRAAVLLSANDLHHEAHLDKRSNRFWHHVADLPEFGTDINEQTNAYSINEKPFDH